MLTSLRAERRERGSENPGTVVKLDRLDRVDPAIREGTWASEPAFRKD